MTDLRARLIEAMARAIGDVTGIDWEQFLVEAEAALDAALDTLTENADETIHPRYNDETSPWRLGDAAVEDLIAALRPPEGE